MRKIVSKHEADKKRRRNQFITGGVLIFVMFTSVMGYAFINNSQGSTSTNSTQTVTYNGINFQNQNGFWVLSTGNKRLVFTYNPLQLSSENLTNITSKVSEFSGKPLYIYSDNANAKSEVEFNMKNYASSIASACPPGRICPGNLTVTASCAENFIIIENGSQGVSQKQNCIYISGEGENLIMLTDKVLFKILGIVK